MSIINDALKKTQNNLQKSDPKEASDVYKKIYQNNEPQKDGTSAPHSQPGETKIKSGKIWHQSILAIVCIALLLAGVLLAVLFYLIKESSSTTSKNAVSSLKLQHEKTKSSPPVDPNVLKLDGIMLTSGKRSALINGEVYEMGEMVNGKKIVNIDADRVDLLENGRMETLKVH